VTGSEQARSRRTRTGGQPRHGEYDYDAVIVGASLAGCCAATLLARNGLQVALVDKRPDPAAFKRICSHYIQPSAIGTLQRLGLLEAIEQMGGLRGYTRMWTRWGWILPPDNVSVPPGVNVRRRHLDPLIRRIAAQTPGVELMLGYTADELLSDDHGTAVGVAVRDRSRRRTFVRAPLTIGADGRGSRLAELGKVARRTWPHGRFAYAAYYEGPAATGAPDGSVWILDPQIAAAFPTDEGLTMYACMPTMDRLPEFRRDPRRALERFLSGIPDAPPVLDSRPIDGVQGKLDLTNVMHEPIAPGLALAGDAALATDPLCGVGCGFALQSAEWLADAATPALHGQRPLAQALTAYRTRFAKTLHPHAELIHDYASGRRQDAGERLVFSAACNSERMANLVLRLGARTLNPRSFVVRGLPLAVAVHTGNALGAPVRRWAPQAAAPR
jgi:2-polyprenyl-6-methoxyphenol hydroxylase-like FAD-dependent oxidoreductase